jgi:hypothetical protein
MLRPDVDGGHAGAAGTGEGTGVGVVGHDGDHVSGQATFDARVEDGLQVRARSRGQDDEASHHGSTVDGAPADSAELDEKSSR